MNKSAFFNAIRPVFGGRLTQGQVEGMNFLLDYRAKNYPQVTDAQMAYILATVAHETARTMSPIVEMGSQSYLRGKRYWPYIGRGYVQLTHKENYAHYGLVSHPDKALEPDTAAHVLFDGVLNGVFGGKLGTYINGSKCDYVNARRCVNVLDRAKEIASIANKFKSALAVAAKAPADTVAVPHGVEHGEKSVFDEIGDFFDWTRHPEEATRQAPAPAAPTLKGQSGYILAAIIAAVAALNNIDGAEWARTIQDPSGHLPMIATAIAIAIANAVLPAWVKWLLPAAPKLRA